MHDATCSKCGAECQVPFRPNGSKPVLCSNCFRGSDASSGFAPRNDRAPSASGSSDQMAQINAKLDKILRVLQELEIDTGDEASEDMTSEDTQDDSEEDEEDTD